MCNELGAGGDVGPGDGEDPCGGPERGHDGPPRAEPFRGGARQHSEARREEDANDEPGADDGLNDGRKGGPGEVGGQELERSDDAERGIADPAQGESGGVDPTSHGRGLLTGEIFNQVHLNRLGRSTYLLCDLPGGYVKRTVNLHLKALREVGLLEIE